jgi:hypothetical protein
VLKIAAPVELFQMKLSEVLGDAAIAGGKGGNK